MGTIARFDAEQMVLEAGWRAHVDPLFGIFPFFPIFRVFHFRTTTVLPKSAAATTIS
jgi:hypothetical protein